MKSRSLVAVLLAFWLVFGPLANAWAQSADRPCESMTMSMPADDCCGSGMDQAKCLSACLAVSAAMPVSWLSVEPVIAVSTAVPAPSSPVSSVLAPPDAAPPKAFVS
jgi:hypothetical protein